MLAELMRKHGGIKPVEGKLPAMHHIDHRIEHARLLPHLVTEQNC